MSLYILGNIHIETEIFIVFCPETIVKTQSKPLRRFRYNLKYLQNGCHWCRIFYKELEEFLLGEESSQSFYRITFSKDELSIPSDRLVLAHHYMITVYDYLKC